MEQFNSASLDQKLNPEKSNLEQFYSASRDQKLNPEKQFYSTSLDQKLNSDKQFYSSSLDQKLNPEKITPEKQSYTKLISKIKAKNDKFNDKRRRTYFSSESSPSLTISNLTNPLPILPPLTISKSMKLEINPLISYKILLSNSSSILTDFRKRR